MPSAVRDEQGQNSTVRKSMQSGPVALGSHRMTMENAGYVRIDKDFVGKRPRTRASVTPSGGRAFRGHMDYLREIIESAGGG